MLNEFIERTIVEISKITHWPRLEVVRETMQRVAREMEAEALAKPIVETILPVQNAAAVIDAQPEDDTTSAATVAEEAASAGADDGIQSAPAAGEPDAAASSPSSVEES